MATFASSAHRKIVRADAHLQSLAKTIQRGIRPIGYGVQSHLDPQTGKYVLRILRPPSRLNWGSLRVLDVGIHIGDVIHNLRSALDHLVWGLTIEFCVDPPPAGDRAWKNVAFPIYWREPDHRLTKELWGVPEPYRTMIKDHQPYIRRRNSPKRDPLWFLHEFSNIDKHRTINLIRPLIKVSNLLPPNNVRVLSEELFDWQPFERDAKLARATFAKPFDPKMDVNVDYAYDVAFEEGDPPFGGPVRETLAMIRADAFTIVETIEARWAGTPPKI